MLKMQILTVFHGKSSRFSNLRTVKGFLDLLSCNRISLGTRKYVSNLGPSSSGTHCRGANFCHFDRRDTLGVNFPSSNVSEKLVTSRFINSHESVIRFYRTGHATNQVRKSEQSTQDLVEALHQKDGQITVGQKVKQAGKDASYMGVLLIGFGVTGVLIWYVLSELLFSFSPNSVYSKALDVVKQNAEVSNVVGEPIKAYGEETSRGRRRHVSHQEYIVEGINYMRVKFYISGSKRKATVHVDTKETSRGKFEFRYIFVELETYPAETIVVIDNR